MPVRVPRLDQPPHRCGFTLRGEDPEGFYVGEVLSGWDPTAAISISYARSLARELGYIHPDEHQSVVDAHARAIEDIFRLTEEKQALEARFDAIDVLASAGFQARKKPGRPVNQVKEVAA